MREEEELAKETLNEIGQEELYISHLRKSFLEE